MELITEQFAEMQLHKESKSQHNDALKNIIAPEKFNDAKKWVVFKEGFRNYISGMNGSSCIPIEYIIRMENLLWQILWSQ